MDKLEKCAICKEPIDTRSDTARPWFIHQEPHKREGIIHAACRFTAAAAADAIPAELARQTARTAELLQWTRGALESFPAFREAAEESAANLLTAAAYIRDYKAIQAEADGLRDALREARREATAGQKAMITAGQEMNQLIKERDAARAELRELRDNIRGLITRTEARYKRAAGDAGKERE